MTVAGAVSVVRERFQVQVVLVPGIRVCDRMGWGSSRGTNVNAWFRNSPVITQDATTDRQSEGDIRSLLKLYFKALFFSVHFYLTSRDFPDPALHTYMHGVHGVGSLPRATTFSPRMTPLTPSSHPKSTSPQGSLRVLRVLRTACTHHHPISTALKILVCCLLLSPQPGNHLSVYEFRPALPRTSYGRNRATRGLPDGPLSRGNMVLRSPSSSACSADEIPLSGGSTACLSAPAEGILAAPQFR